MRAVGIVAKARLERAAGLLAEIAAWLERRNITPVFEVETAALARTAGADGRLQTVTADDLPRHVDVIVVLGGDGTLLGTAGRIAKAKADIPILGVNFGSLGFLTEIQLPELYESLESVLDGDADVEERMMLRARTLRDGEVFADRLVVNDVVITRAALSRIIDLSVSIGEQLVMQVRADGLIVATPTGSSAYNLAAGGPIVHPSVDAVLLTPIAPHMLTNRPVVLPGSSAVRVQPMMNGAEEVYVTFDGQSGHPLQADDEIEITKAELTLRLVRASQRTYFDVLRQKLKWGAR
jgi:NAD+ kinase